MENLLYPVDWPTITRQIKDANHYKCQACDKQCRRPGEMWLGWNYEMAIAHICQDYEAESVFVVAICAHCHLVMDAPYSGTARRRRLRLRRYLAGQLEFFSRQ